MKVKEVTARKIMAGNNASLIVDKYKAVKPECACGETK